MTNAGPCKKACRECPFKRTSVAGWLGEASFDEDPASSFLDPHWDYEQPLPCHMQVRWEDADSQQQAQEKPLCFGYLTMMKNSCKLPRDRELAAQVKAMDRNTDDFFLFPQEFKTHHNGGLK